jgi:hypothetical protein
MAHNNFSNFVDGQFARMVMDMRPAKGHHMLWQGFVGWVWSGTDFFVTGAGMMGTETTIGGFTAYKNLAPISCRIRQAMQFGSSIDDYAAALLKDNSGDYANCWLFGDTKTGEIATLELGLEYHTLERTKNGCYIGYNAPHFDARIRNLECVNSGWDDIRRHQGARRVRLADLTEQYKGQITTQIAKRIISDHFDVYERRQNPCSRTVFALRA